MQIVKDREWLPIIAHFTLDTLYTLVLANGKPFVTNSLDEYLSSLSMESFYMVSHELFITKYHSNFT